MRESSNSSVVHSARDISDHPARAGAGLLLAAAIFYVGATTALRPHKLPATEIVEAFIAGVLPGLFLTVVLWAARPGLFDRRLRRRLIGGSLAGSAVVATIPQMTAGF